MFQTTFDLGDILTFIGLLVAGIGLFLNFWQSHRDSRRHRAELTIRFWEVMDEESLRMWQRITYRTEQLIYNRLSEKDKSALDGLLGYYEMVALMIRDKLVKARDIRPLFGDLKRLAQRDDVFSCVSEYFSDYSELYEMLKHIRGMKMV